MDEAAEVAATGAAHAGNHDDRSGDVLLLPAPSLEQPAVAAGGEASTAAQARPRRPSAQRSYECESHESDDSDRSDGSVGSDGSDTTPKPAATSTTAASRSPAILNPQAACLMADSGGGIANLAALADDDARYDIDGYSCIYRGEAMLDALERAMGDLRIPIDPIGADLAQPRNLYTPSRWAVVGMTQPEVRRGMGAVAGAKPGMKMVLLPYHSRAMSILLQPLSAMVLSPKLGKV